MSKSKVLFILSGSIACYKACQAISKLVQAGCEVQTVASPSALQFIGNATLEGLTGKTVISDLFKAGNVMDHIHLVRWADLIVVAPATASFINKAAQGVGDDLIQTLFLAHDFTKPFLVAPAMNVAMYNHPITQSSLKKLKELGLEIIDSGAGMLACGEEGKGRLAEPEQILAAIFKHTSNEGSGTATTLEPANNSKNNMDSKSMSLESSVGKSLRVLVTAGGTQESIDDVRVLSNTSSGLTGVKIAEYLDHLGFDVTLVKAQNSVRSHLENQKIFSDFKSLNLLLNTELREQAYDCVIHAAAVSDYSVSQISFGNTTSKPDEVKKLSSEYQSMDIHLVKNPKIVDQLKEYSKNKDMKLIAFKLTSNANSEEQKKAVEKLFNASHSDAIIHNDLVEIDKEKGLHKFSFFQQNKDNAVPCESTADLCLKISEFIYNKGIL